jgi:rhomboid protease GluP
MCNIAEGLQRDIAQYGMSFTQFSIEDPARENSMFEEPPSFSHTQQTQQQVQPQVAAEVEQHYREAENFRAAYAAAPQSVVTIALIAINLLIFVLMVIKGVPFMEPTAGDVLPFGANFGPFTLNGEWWRLITGCFLHFGVIHIAMNMIVLYQVGIFTEKLYGNVRYLVMYLLAGVGGNLAGLYIHPNTVSAGASGAVFGVYGALLAYLVVQRGVVPNASAASIAKSSGIFLAINIVYGLRSPNTDMTAHIGGFITGFLVGALLARPIFPSGQRIYPVRTALVILLGCGLSVVTLQALASKSSPVRAAFYRAIYSPSVKAGGNSVFYSGTASSQDAEALGKALIQAGFFQSDGGEAVLTKGSQGTDIYIIVREGVWNDPEIAPALDRLGHVTADAVGGTPATLHLLNGKLEDKKDLHIR